MPKVSIVVTTYNRPHLLKQTLESIVAQEYRDYEVVIVDDGTDAVTPELCAQYSTRYIKTQKRPGIRYSNPARPNNIGVRAAEGDIILLQNAECRHASRELIAGMAEVVGDKNAVFATVESLNEDGTHQMYYTHPVMNPRPFFFCGAIKKKWFEELRGFDEDYIGYGYDDNDFADRLAASGVAFDFSANLKAQHLWHPSSYDANDPLNMHNGLVYAQKTQGMRNGTIGVKRNLEKEWGSIA